MLKIDFCIYSYQYLIEAAQYLSDEHLLREPLVPLEVGMSGVNGSW